jgi:hypothetical protein
MICDCLNRGRLRPSWQRPMVFRDSAVITTGSRSTAAWAAGRRILGSDQPNFPFCLCWANESWTRGWLEEERDVLIPQTYDPHDDLNHCHWLAKAFADRRYLRTKGCEGAAVKT